jgi:5-formyltetrahydrofolate cyclo-ligase
VDKQQQRQIAYAARNAQTDKDEISTDICRKYVEQVWYRAAETVLWYVDCRSEVRTLRALSQELNLGKRIAVPYCTVDAIGEKQLGLWLLNAVEELQPGMWNILEPPRERRMETGRQIGIEELDAVMVPGVAFDKLGGRLGNGAGYYDRLLGKVRVDTVLAAVCYESQLLPRITMDAHDVYMDVVITEKTIYSGRRQKD